MNAIPLSAVDLLVASVLVLAAGAVSVALRLGLERRLGIAAIRTVVQLLLLGYVLEWIFALDSAPAVLGMMGIMVTAAGRAAVKRSARIYEGAYIRAIVSLALTGTITSFTVTGAIIGVDPWYQPQYVIPLLGMILGNALTGISLCLDVLLEAFAERRDLIEMELALGATGWEAVRDHVAGAVRRGMIPIINSMTVVGIVSLPGMMTGQILAGADPFEAVKYQIVVMFMISAGTAFGCVLIAMASYRHLVDDHHRLRADAIQRKKTDR